MHRLGLWHRKFYNLLLYRPSFISRLSREFQWVRSLMPETSSGSQASSGHQHRPLSLRLYRTWTQIRRERNSPGPTCTKSALYVSESVLSSKPLFQVHRHRFAKGTPTSACQPADPLTTPDHVWPRLQEAWGVDRLPTLSPESRETFIFPGWAPSFQVSWEQILGFDPRQELQGSGVWCSLQIIESRL